MANPTQTLDYQKMIARNNAINKNKPPMQSAREMRIKAAEKQNADAINYAVNQVNNLAGEDRITMPEHIFVKYFLPMFAQDKDHCPPNVYQEWLKISKGGMVPVVIVSSEGNDVVTVPPRYSRSLINIRTKRDRISVSDAMMTFSDLAVSSPVRAMNYFNNVVHPNTGDGEVRNKAIETYNEALGKVLQHYSKLTGFSNTKTNHNVTDNEKPKTIYAEDDLL